MFFRFHSTTLQTCLTSGVARSSVAVAVPLRAGCTRREMSSGGDGVLEGAMHKPGESGLQAGSSTTIAGKETWSQFSTKMRYGRRRIRVIDVAAKMSYEYQMLRKMCKRRPAMRQWAVRDDFCDMNPGVVIMSPSMQAAFMKVFRMKEKGLIRQCLRDIVPVIEYRNREEPARLPTNPADMIPEGEPDTLNQKKRELFERREKGENFADLRLHDKRSQAKLRFRIRQRLLKFQRQLAVANAIASRSVLYSTNDAIGYFLFRGAAMYAGMHRVFFELSKQLPHFVPKTMLDFGAGTGTAILVAKEVYDPGSLAYPLYRSLRQTMQGNDSSRTHQLSELRYDLKRLQRNNEEKKKVRFMAVAALLERGEVDPADLPEDLKREIAEVATAAATAKKDRLVREAHARYRDVVDGTEWESGDPLGEVRASTEDPEDVIDGEQGDGGDDGEAAKGRPKTWWEKLIDVENETARTRAARRLRPLQEVTAVEPSPGMMEIGTMVLHDDVPNVTWKRYLLPEDEAIQHDLVVAAYSLSEIATSENRRRIVQQLWKMTKGVLVFVEFANLNNFNILMEARDWILEEKDVGLWDWQPTIVAPCPHEHRCPLRHCKTGVKRKRMRICSTEAHYRSTFVEVWARHMPLKVGIEPISYLILARNELVPERAERRREQLKKAEEMKRRERDVKQQQLHEASLAVKDVVFECLSDEALHRVQSGVPQPLTDIDEVREASTSATSTSLLKDLKDGATSTGEIGHMPTDVPRLVKTGNTRHNRLIFPLQFPPATHKFNRAFVDAGYQRQRAITPAEMLVVRQEVEQLQQRVMRAAPKYLRVVRDPRCHGKVQADFCTPEGDLVSGRVYRRFYGDRNRVSAHSTMRWQHIGGWKLLKRIRRGSLFPHNVPLYAVTKHAQIDFPNTLLDTKHSTVEQTAMQYNDPMSLVEMPDDGLTREELKQKRRLQRDVELQKKVEEKLEDIFGVNAKDWKTDDLGGGRLDARREISEQQWADAVRRAKIRTVQHTKNALPFAAKKRAAQRALQVRRRNVRLEMSGNRRR
ncbi:hypothetical protein, conserved [Trypanosoma brucei gambiense DAL972]|uniref:Methyltransferase n=1 Tax=Trypanosoma brucei gambiense (strain MHOM/CI/86/DAL972) TaxID=679716 RepID=D0A703_TRYB9|nr:hypothetical protein, conserved [Trypanosoma brucei gambiense DAL972]CBH17454.1 hypothetical protein, conserved [Trypanosoma brucei gambiense DAL972]|eukprot:XP_011779718.1 hypothetical protein, conserved [Trypanosoma brucei gambiense DAL972]